MAITSYSELLTALENWIARSDLDDRYPECIALAEGVANRHLDCQQMSTRNASFSINAVSVAVPTRFAGVRAFKLNTATPSPLFYVKPDDFDDPREAAYPATGQPGYYTILGDAFLFSPTPDSTYTATLVYRTNLTPLSTSNASNWLLAGFPDVYLHGALAFAYQFIEDDAMEAKMRGLFLSGLGEINALNNRIAFGSSPARRVRGFA